MAFARYLIRFSYIGTYFRGAQWVNFTRNQTESVEGSLLLGLENLNIVRDSVVLSSSFYPLIVRTDSGVHALNSSAHFDVKPWRGNFPDQNHIMRNVNKYFTKSKLGVVVHQVLRVPTDFSARYNAISRTYLYRIAFKNKEAFQNNIVIRVPVEEWRKVFFIRNMDIDVNKLRDAMKLFEGTHDFETFKKRRMPGSPWKHSIRRIDFTDVYPGLPMRTTYDAERFKYLEYWDIIIKGKAFVHNQVRRIIGAAIAVASEKVDISEISTMLTVPSNNSWNNLISVVPAEGLYLCNVEYDENDLIFKEDPNEEQFDSILKEDQNKKQSDSILKEDENEEQSDSILKEDQNKEQLIKQ